MATASLPSFNSQVSGKNCLYDFCTLRLFNYCCTPPLPPFLHQDAVTEVTHLPAAKPHRCFLALEFQGCKIQHRIFYLHLEMLSWESVTFSWFFFFTLVSLLCFLINFSFYCILLNVGIFQSLVIGFYFLTIHVSSDLSFHSYLASDTISTHKLFIYISSQNLSCTQNCMSKSLLGSSTTRS